MKDVLSNAEVSTFKLRDIDVVSNRTNAATDSSVPGGTS